MDTVHYAEPQPKPRAIESIAAGAGYMYAFAGDICTMPGLPSHPAVLDIDIDADGRITGMR